MDFSAFYTDTENFVAYGSEHLISVIVVMTFGIWFLRKGKYSWNEDQKWRYAIVFAAILYGIQLFKTFARVYLGNFDITEDLPLQLCNMLPLFVTIGLYLRSRLLLSVTFFWILAGTAQANITPTLQNTLPHYEAIRYWTIHMGLPIIAIYTYYALGFRFRFKDAVRSALALNLLAAIIYPLNHAFGSNYLYFECQASGNHTLFTSRTLAMVHIQLGVCHVDLIFHRTDTFLFT